MQQTFTKVFKAEGTGKRGPWTRWDYKNAAEERFVHFAPTQQIELNTPVYIEADEGGKITTFSFPVAESGQQESSNGSEGVTLPLTVLQGPSERDTQIHRQTAAKVAAKLLDTFEPEERTLDTFFVVAEKLVDYFQNGVK